MRYTDQKLVSKLRTPVFQEQLCLEFKNFKQELENLGIDVSSVKYTDDTLIQTLHFIEQTPLVSLYPVETNGQNYAFLGIYGSTPYLSFANRYTLLYWLYKLFFYLLTKDLSNEFENNVAEELLLTIHDWFLLTEQAPDKTNTPLLLDGTADKKVLKDYGLRFTKSDKHLYRVSLPRATKTPTFKRLLTKLSGSRNSLSKDDEQRQGGKKHHVLRRVIPILCIVIGLCFVLFRPIRNSLLAWQTNKYQITNISKKTIVENQTKEANYDYSSVDTVSLSTILDAQMNSQDLSVIGGIAIPDLSINLPIFKGVGNAELSFGAGTMKENQQMGVGNYALASHHVFGIDGSSNMLFSPLVNAKEGMSIYLTDKEYIYTYKISQVYEVDPTAVEVVNDTEGVTEVTLVTCTDEQATARIIVKGSYVKKTKYSKATKAMKKAFSLTYNQIQK